MKRPASLLLGLCALVLLFAGCQVNPRTKALVIINNGTSAIDYVMIKQYITQATKSVGANALLDGATIPVGGRETFYLAPYASTESSPTYTSLYVEDSALNYDTERFTFDPSMYDDIIATYDGTSLTLSGSGVYVYSPT
jgi:hypothetical protein